MKLIFIGADHEVTGSCHFLSLDHPVYGSKPIYMLVDCGMEQGRDYFENKELPVKAKDIRYVFLTHAHVDHSGMLPKLYHDGFRGTVLTTSATKDLSEIMLRDAAHIQAQDAEYARRKRGNNPGPDAEPSFTMEDAEGLIRLIEPYRYDKIYDLGEGIRFRFTDIGHLLGSASVEIWLEEKDPDTEAKYERKLVFSGDIGNRNQPILRDPKRTAEADYVIMESTYGDRLHEASQCDYITDLAEIIRRTLLRGGNLVIPSFAVGRTQVMLYFIRQIKREGLVPEIPDFPVYVDSPMAVDATSVFHENDRECYDEEAQKLLDEGVNPLIFPRLYLSITQEESKAINTDEEPKVIISASGMCDAGRIRHHLKYNLWRKESTILFVGYQTVGSLGRKLLDGADSVRMFGVDIDVKAEVLKLPGLSGHADRDGLLWWLEGFEEKPGHVYVVHGDDEAAESFTALLREKGYQADAPFSGTAVDLKTGEFLLKTEGVPIRKKISQNTESDAYRKLKSTAKQLEEQIVQSRGLPNKELTRFAEELEKLMKKYRID
ncbi:MAG: MBL fold metallo-hydrolase [Lachnospiraceae bacterium]|nr:MBL fold metallo-hydrolase [Lachnospiraceae bacterium]